MASENSSCSSSSSTSIIDQELVLKPAVPTRRAVVVGCNYKAYKKEKWLYGCINDAHNIVNMLTEHFNFKSGNIKVLTDDDSKYKWQLKTKPTSEKIKLAIQHIIRLAKTGDVLFFFFAGHGIIVNGQHCIVGSDDNIIAGIDVGEIVDKHLPKGATFTIMIDSCYSGNFINEKLLQIGQASVIEKALAQVEEGTSEHGECGVLPHTTLLHSLAEASGLNSPDIGAHIIHLFGVEASKIFLTPPEELRKYRMLKADQVIFISGCSPSELTTDFKKKGEDQRRGAFTYAIQTAILENKGPRFTNSQLVMKVRNVLESIKGELVDKKQKGQHPFLYCSKAKTNEFFLHIPN